MSVTYGCDRCGKTTKEFPGIRDWRTLIWLDDVRQAEPNQVGTLLCVDCVAAVRRFIATNLGASMLCRKTNWGRVARDEKTGLLPPPPEAVSCIQPAGHTGDHRDSLGQSWSVASPRACGAAAWNGEVRCTKTIGHFGRHQNDAGYTWEPR